MVCHRSTAASKREKRKREAKQLAKREEEKEAEARRLLPFTPPSHRSLFLKLPPEIRKRILETLLVLGIVHIGTFARLGQYNPKTVFEYCAYQYISKKTSTRRKIDLSIARVNKKLREEAEAVVYGGNCFVFREFGQLRAFMGTGPDFYPFLKHLQLGAGFQNNEKFYAKILTCLTDCSNLRTLTISHQQACRAMRKCIRHLTGYRTSAILLWYRLRRRLDGVRLVQTQQCRGDLFPQLINIAPPALNTGCGLKEISPECTGRNECRTTCGLMETHCNELSKQYNDMLATYFEDAKQGFERFQKIAVVIPKGPEWTDGQSERFYP